VRDTDSLLFQAEQLELPLQINKNSPILLKDKLCLLIFKVLSVKTLMINVLQNIKMETKNA
jgi:hypothetical protein